MSAYIKMTTPMTDRECLLQALADVGIGADRVEESQQQSHSQGYQEDQRPQTVDVIVRRNHSGRSLGDIRFRMTPHGYQVQLSRSYGRQWLTEVVAHYRRRLAQKVQHMAELERRRLEEERKRLVQQQKKAVYERARKMGYSVKETRAEGKVRLVLVKRSY